MSTDTYEDGDDHLDYRRGEMYTKSWIIRDLRSSLHAKIETLKTLEREIDAISKTLAEIDN